MGAMSQAFSGLSSPRAPFKAAQGIGQLGSMGKALGAAGGGGGQPGAGGGFGQLALGMGGGQPGGGGKPGVPGFQPLNQSVGDAFQQLQGTLGPVGQAKPLGPKQQALQQPGAAGAPPPGWTPGTPLPQGWNRVIPFAPGAQTRYVGPTQDGGPGAVGTGAPAPGGPAPAGGTGAPAAPGDPTQVRPHGKLLRPLAEGTYQPPPQAPSLKSQFAAGTMGGPAAPAAPPQQPFGGFGPAFRGPLPARSALGFGPMGGPMGRFGSGFGGWGGGGWGGGYAGGAPAPGNPENPGGGVAKQPGGQEQVGVDQMPRVY